MTEPMFLYGIFVNHHKKTFSSGVSTYTRGHFPVIVQKIPSFQKTDWTMGPVITPGHWGAYRGVSLADWCMDGFCHHGPYPYATAPTLDKIKHGANGDFLFQLGPWSACNNLKSLEATMRYRGYEGFDDSLLP